MSNAFVNCNIWFAVVAITNNDLFYIPALIYLIIFLMELKNGCGISENEKMYKLWW